VRSLDSSPSTPADAFPQRRHDVVGSAGDRRAEGAVDAARASP
jgi:hypothetical protein